ncbi:NAD+ synthase [Laspinema olomoucense]|uniref:Glutamine-dependent NAD(+) synthetase n=1 Tax=Laspinema olomoucense D3b TaxID=2953688 RepID=A0ABT2N9Q5_9CYAN|nr:MULTISPECIES: NAD+ synthase [unclassified Laspinema]MCT7979428.1 NAD+ synthase [Laspinema sp. D3b]MCT7987231.1 NAD+ synthase [Laspinema sp. D3a]MCT7992204.1 NAD+ synthase [Laspinema sp. D3c]
MKIAIAQLNPTIGDLRGNSQQILQAATQAAAQGIDLMLTPELSLCGYPPRDLLLRPSFIEAMSWQLQQLAQELPPAIAVLVGTVETHTLAHTTGGKSLYNSIALLFNGKIQQYFHKRLLPTYDVFDENRYFEPSYVSNYFNLGEFGFPSHPQGSPPIRIGVTICEDLWNDEEFWGKRQYPSNPIANLVEEGADVIINLSASPYTVGKQKLREAMLNHVAVRYHKPIIYANQVGGNDDLIFDGYSIAFNKLGERVALAAGFQPDLVAVELDEKSRDLRPLSLNKEAIASQPLTQTQGTPLSPAEEIWSALVLGVRDYTRKCGFSKVVIGLSGGIDSSLVAAIASEAIGPSNVIGILMSSPHTSQQSVIDAVELAQNLGLKTYSLPIADLMDCYDKTLGDLFADSPRDVTEENLQARIRGNLLMAISNKFGYLLISTGNKSEMAVGYCTLYGDMNGGLAAISDVLKTQVYAICQWLNSREPGKIIIPESVLSKPPSAELKPGQIDQDSLPPYDILDDILDRLIHNHESIPEIVAAGHETALVQRVVKLLNGAEFKRRQAPPGLKVTDRAFGTGWRMPIAAKVPQLPLCVE